MVEGEFYFIANVSSIEHRRQMNPNDLLFLLE